MFQLNQRPDRSLFSRILRAATFDVVPIARLTSSYKERNVSTILEKVKADVKVPTKRASVRKVVVTTKVEEQIKNENENEKEIIFIDVSQSEEIEQKDSFINEEEATSVMDYIKAHHTHLFEKGQTCAVMSPFRP